MRRSFTRTVFAKGDTVMIYIDPLAETRPEGTARLHKLQKVSRRTETWLVVFDNDDQMLLRKIRRDGKNTNKR